MSGYQLRLNSEVSRQGVVRSGRAIDARTAVVVCAGPSLNRFSTLAWEKLSEAGAVAAVNGALASLAFRRSGLKPSCAAAVNLGDSNDRSIWERTSAWRLALADCNGLAAESFVQETPYFSDHPDRAFVGRSGAIFVGNWLCNPWSREEREAAESTAAYVEKRVPKRGFNKLIYVGLDAPSELGANFYENGYESAGEVETRAAENWRRFCRAARERGIEVFSLTLNRENNFIPKKKIPSKWLAY